MVCFRRRGLRWLLLRESSLDATLVDRYRLGWRGWRVPTHDLPLAGSLDASGLEEVEDIFSHSRAVLMVPDLRRLNTHMRWSASPMASLQTGQGILG